MRHEVQNIQNHRIRQNQKRTKPTGAYAQTANSGATR